MWYKYSLSRNQAETLIDSEEYKKKGLTFLIRKGCVFQPVEKRACTAAGGRALPLPSVAGTARAIVDEPGVWARTDEFIEAGAL